MIKTHLTSLVSLVENQSGRNTAEKVGNAMAAMSDEEAVSHCRAAGLKVGRGPRSGALSIYRRALGVWLLNRLPFAV